MFLNAVTDVLYLIEFFIIGRYFFGFKRQGSQYRTIFFLGITFLVSILFSFMIKNPILLFCVYLVYLYCIMCKMYLVPRQMLFRYTFIMYIILSFFDQMIYVLVKSIFQIINCIIDNTIIKTIVSCMMISILYFIGRSFEKILKDRLQSIEKKYVSLFTLLLIIDSSIVTTLGDFALNVFVTKKQVLFGFFYILVVMGIFFQLFLVVALILSRNMYREKEALAIQYLNDQKQHYEYLKNRERETRKFRHDLKNHLYLLNNIYTHGNLPEFHTYLDQLNQKIESFNNKISVNNEIADAIFNKFYYECEKQHILLHIDGHFPLTCHIPTFDLCTILSNLLSNALHAQTECNGGQIDVTIRSTDSEITIKIENQYLEEPIQKEGLFETQKTDKENHGFGLENVKDCVEKNHGQIIIETENKQFKVMLSLHYECCKDTAVTV